MCADMNALPRLPILLFVTALAAACASAPERPSVALPEVTGFSGLRPDDTIPAAWQSWSLSRFKQPSRYKLIEDAGSTVVHARAQASASGMIHYLDIDPRERPLLSWRWKVMDLFPSTSSADDSPARIVVSFDGDLEKLDFSDRLFYDQFRLFTGQQLPYAALMYVWGSRTPKEGIVPNPYTSRIKIIVVESGRERLGEWLSEQRNVAADFRRAFGEDPGKIISVGILTETDAGDRPIEVYYGDLSFNTPSTLTQADKAP
jgi:hypothetical protein